MLLRTGYAPKSKLMLRCYVKHSLSPVSLLTSYSLRYVPARRHSCQLLVVSGCDISMVTTPLRLCPPVEQTHKTARNSVAFFREAEKPQRWTQQRWHHGELPCSTNVA